MAASHVLALAFLVCPVLISAGPVVSVSSEVTDVGEVTESLPEVVVHLTSKEEQRNQQSPLTDHAALPAQQDLQTRKKKSPYCVQVHSDHPNEPAYEVCGQKVPVEPHSHNDDYDPVHNLANAAIASAAAPNYGVASQAPGYGTPSYHHTTSNVVPNYGPAAHQAPSYAVVAPQAPNYGTPGYGSPHVIALAPHNAGSPNYTPLNYQAPSHVISSYAAPVYSVANFPASAGYAPHNVVPSYTVSSYAAPHSAAPSYAAPKPSAAYFSSASPAPHAAYSGTYQPLSAGHSDSSYNAAVSPATVSSTDKDSRISLMPSYTSYGTQKMRADEGSKILDKNETTSRASEYDAPHEHSQNYQFPLKFFGYISPASLKSDSLEAYGAADDHDDSKSPGDNYDVPYTKSPVTYHAKPYDNKVYNAPYPYVKPPSPIPYPSYNPPAYSYTPIKNVPIPYPSYTPPAYSYAPIKKVPVSYAPTPYSPPQYVYATPNYVTHPSYGGPVAPPSYGHYGVKPGYSTSIPISIACQVIATPGHGQSVYTRSAPPVYTCVIQDKSTDYGSYRQEERSSDNKKGQTTHEHQESEGQKTGQDSSGESSEEKATTNPTVMVTSTHKSDVQQEPKADEGKPPVPMKKPQHFKSQSMQHPSPSMLVGHNIFPPPPFPQYGPDFYGR